MKQFITNISSIGLSLIALFALTFSLQAQQQKDTLSLEDAKLWRTHSTSLSDDGNWYTVQYSLIEKADSEKAPKKDSSALKKDSIDIYGEDFSTDVLYIYNSESGIKYRIPRGESPKFSDNSEWIAYSISPDPDKKKKAKEKEKTVVELKNLSSGLTRQFETNASFQFTKETNFFISSDNNSLLIYNLDNNKEHFIGNIGEYLIDKKTSSIAYTIKSKDKRGNGIYVYNPEKMTTQALETGNFIYAYLSWNHKKNSLAAIRYNVVDKKVDFENISLLLVSKIGQADPSTSVYLAKNMSGLPENMSLAADTARRINNITWSKDEQRLFFSICEYDTLKTDIDKKDKTKGDKSTVSVWHWKDEKLLSQRMKENERKRKDVYEAAFTLKSKNLIQLCDEGVKRLNRSKGTDRWAIGTDDRAYVSDWDVRKVDVYKVNLLTGERILIEKAYPGTTSISPDGEKVVLWKEGHFWAYDFNTDERRNISADLDVSFINQENDHWGSEPSYGFVAWVKDENSVLVNHKLDLWVLSLDGKKQARNLTQSITSKESIRFRIDDLSFMSKPEIEERYIDLKNPLILNAFNTNTKYAGFFQLTNKKLDKIIYAPASFGSSGWRSGLTKAKNSDVIIFKKGDYVNYPESYLSDIKFSDPKPITKTNPQQENFNWGHRILIDYKNDDGVPLQGILSIPDAYTKGQKLPMIVYSYEKSSQNMFSYASPRIGGAGVMEMLYVSDGYLFLQPDIHFNVGTPHSDMHECIDAALEKVIELGYVDERYIGYEGFSYGGHCGMYISTQENKFAAIAAGAGVSNLVQGFNLDIVGDGSNEQDYYMKGQGRLGTDPTGNTEMYISESAVFNAATMNTPLMLFHGTVDNVVKWEHSFGFYSILRYLKKPVVFLSYHGEGHGLRQKGNRFDIQTRLKEYFDHYLKGKEAGAWITEGLPYPLEGKEKEKQKLVKSKKTNPQWK